MFSPLDAEFPEDPFFRTFPAAGFPDLEPLVEALKLRALLVVRQEILLFVSEWFAPEFPLWKLTTILFVSVGCVELYILLLISLFSFSDPFCLEFTLKRDSSVILSERLCCLWTFCFELEFWNMDKKELFFAVADVSDVDDFLLWISIFSDVVFTGDKPFSFLDTFDDMAKNQSGQTFAPFLIVTWYCFGFHIIVRM